MAAPSQPGTPVVALARARLLAARSRGEIKRLGHDADQDAALHAALVAIAAERGEPPDPALDGRRLVRLLLDRGASAHQRSTPQHRDPGFTCGHCGHDVPPGGARVRDHCPRCLRGLHVDIVPGDRENPCRSLTDPVSATLSGRDGAVLVWVCRRCGERYRGRAHPDDQLPVGLRFDAGWDAALGPPVAGAGTSSWERARTLPLRVLDHLRRQRLWAPDERVVVAVSGGLDSTVLLEVLARARGAHRGLLEVASVDHGLRPESVAEVNRVARHAAALGLPFHALQLDLAPGAGLAERARDLRRAALAGLGAPVVATGHHLDDQAETVLQHLLRGAGAQGLAGMQAARAHAGVRWVRPLLLEPRAVLQAWAEAEGLSWVEDPSNAESERGKLRRLVPALQDIRPGAVGALARSARLLARDDDCLGEIASAAGDGCRADGGVRWEALQALHPAIAARVLRSLLEGVLDLRAEHIEAALNWDPQEGAALDLPGGLRLLYRRGVIGVDAG